MRTRDIHVVAGPTSGGQLLDPNGDPLLDPAGAQMLEPV